jgi:two-component system OmpR family sensor kinase
VIPRLPIRARGFLRLRRDLPTDTRALLERLGIRDRGLPRPATIADPADTLPAPQQRNPRRPIPANDLAGEPAAPRREPAGDDSEIGALVRRIAEFRRHRADRENGDDAPLLPLGTEPRAARPALAEFAFTTDAEGRIDWAGPEAAPMVVGALLAPAAIAARGRHGRLQGEAIEWAGAPAVAGAWVVDAAPRFSDPGGRFIGFAGRFRRPAPAIAQPALPDPAADRMRQLLHELRTPVNAIQGFAEVIQQQLFGPTPHEYRALAAAIAGDAARLLAGFGELDRLARLETGAMAIDDGTTDWFAIVEGLARQLGEVLRPRGAEFVVSHSVDAADVPMPRDDAEALAWRLLATLAGAAGPGERLTLDLMADDGLVVLTAGLPAALAAQDDVFTADNRATGAVSAGMFGAGFALRLARAEARAVGGSLVREAATLVLRLPRLTASGAGLSPASEADSARG